MYDEHAAFMDFTQVRRGVDGHSVNKRVGVNALLTTMPRDTFCSSTWSSPFTSTAYETHSIATPRMYACVHELDCCEVAH